MEELLNDFLIETGEHIDAATQQLVLFEDNPNDKSIIASIFRLVHTIKGTCGFLGLNRLERIAHAAEALIGRLRDGAPATAEVVTLVLAAIDRIKFILAELEKTSAEPVGNDADLIGVLEEEMTNWRAVEIGNGPGAASHAFWPDVTPAPVPAPVPDLQHDTVATPARDADADPQLAARPVKRNETIRVTVGAIERIMVLVSELVLTRNQLLELTRRQEDDTVKAPLQRLSSLTSDLQDAVMRARMQPVSRLFSTLPRLVRELAADCRKKLHLVTDGGDTELDRQLIEIVRDPLTHMLRNCADHGIELPEVRLQLGKPEAGTIQVKASHEAGYITIDVMDDGRGLDAEKIRRQAVKNGLISSADAAAMPDDAVYRFVLAPNFSTASEVTSISGRGVGMDVVRENIESVGGSVSVSTSLGKGTRFSLKIPLTLAIAPALIVHVGGRRFALPQHSVVEAVGVGPGSEYATEYVQGGLILRLRDAVLPLADLRALLSLGDHPDGGAAGSGLAVVMRVGAVSFGMLVDGVSDVQEIVVKPLGASLAHLDVYSGHTILGDGSVVLILDPTGIAAGLGLESTSGYAAGGSSDTYVQAAEMTRLIMFRAGDGLRKALPLSLIGRIEIVAASAIERSGTDLVMQHQGHLMPVMRLKSPSNPDAAEYPVLVLSIGGESMGIVVDEIIDIIEDVLDVEIAGGDPGIIGTARLRDAIVEIIDVTHFLRMARPNAFARAVTKRFEVLLVDDKLFFRDMLSPILIAAGYRVTTAASGEAALDLFARGAQFDAVITDTDMPGISGYALAQKLRRDVRCSQMPIIALAAHATDAVKQASAASGIKVAVGKFDRATLLSELGRMLTPQALNINDLEMRVIGGLAA